VYWKNVDIVKCFIQKMKNIYKKKKELNISEKMTKLFRHKQKVIPVCYFIFLTKLNSNAFFFFLQIEIKKVEIPG
jgi:hypothetical protein